ncbi:SpoIIE family protein phosphatase [bacterium]|nr:SpoIIE family protein phosphatase [bacterium]
MSLHGLFKDEQVCGNAHHFFLILPIVESFHPTTIGNNVIDTLDTRCPRIRLCSTAPERMHDIRSMLDIANYDTSFCPLSVDRLELEGIDDLDLVLIEGPASAEERVLDFCRQFRHRLNNRFVPLIFVTDDHDHVLRAFSSRIGTDGYLVRPFDPVVLLSQVQALLRIKFLQDQVVEQSREIEQAHQQLHRAYQQVDQELELAGRIQQSFLPRDLPNDEAIRFGVKMSVFGQVSGDIYDVVRLNKRQTAFYLADAMGHGVPAGLLTIFVKKGVQLRETIDSTERILTPGDAMERLNRDIVRQDLSENPFITMAYCTFDQVTRELQFARGGHPYPLLIPPKGPIQELKAEGTLLGVFETDYETQRHTLQPGDKVLLYTDGIDCARFGGEKQGNDSFRACLNEHRGRPIQELINRVFDDLFPDGQIDDDFTLVGMECVDTTRINSLGTT